MDYRIKRSLGKSLVLYLKSGAAVYLKFTSFGPDWIGGFDDEGLDMRFYLIDIDFAREVQ